MKMHNQKRSQQGSAIVMVMVAVLVLMITGVGLMSLGAQGRIRAIRTSEEIEARGAADAGLQKAIYEMNQQLMSKKFGDSSMPYATSQTLPNCDSIFSYKVAAASGKSEYIVASVGTSGRVMKSVSATLGLQGLYEYAILAQNSLILKSDTIIDGYNSSDLSDTDNGVEIATLSTASDQIILNMNVTVNGDVLVGLDGDPSVTVKDLGGVVNGLKRPMREEPPLPEITPPTLVDKATGLTAQGAIITLTQADSGVYSEIRLEQEVLLKKELNKGAIPKPALIVIESGQVDLHITGDIWLGNSCEIVVNADATLRLYVDGDIVTGNSSNVGYLGSPKEPDHLWLYATGDDTQTFDLKAKNDWSGVVYAPNADIDLYAKGDIYGAFVADNFEFKAGGNFYYDEALRDVSIYDFGVRFTVKRWNER
ncbi:MAG: DUF7305 domain-containing protein [Planctomycetota bacterium]|jgi:hypothetical protein